MKMQLALLLPRRHFHASVALLTGLMLNASFGAQAEGAFPKLTPELYGELNANLDTTWPHDPVVPELPLMPVTDDPEMNQEAFLWTHFKDNVYKPKIEGVPAPRTRLVTEDDPMEVDVYWSMRSPYSYLVLNRLVWLNSYYNVDVNIRIVLPVAVRSTKGGGGKAGGLFSLPYKVPDMAWDAPRQGKFHGVPFSMPVPDPVWMVWNPKGKVPGPENWLNTHPPEKQQYIFWITRLACYAEKQGKALEFVNQVSSLIWIDNAEGMAATGHGGVPLMVHHGEPFFGGDRFDQFVWRLRQSGLTRRTKARAPLTTKPLRWPVGF